MLEEDAMRFDAFLKENDYKAVEAIRKAEQETKAKQVRFAVLPISLHAVSPPPPTGTYRRNQTGFRSNRVCEKRHGPV